ncbi:carbamoyltransferase HypF [Thermobrachium celere]|uniref:carbamoyltransferase HypF n=1 Tax=Thermobrachium celere TaxID=53422 RepID=UPI001FAEFB12|nr:carbamoyltransferase HypF [Thermobrachium celere]
MKLKRANIVVNGIVQGVGFRPFIHKLISEYELKGWVKNTSSGVVIEVEGELDKIHCFVEDIKIKKPKLSVIESINLTVYDELLGYNEFRIIESTNDTTKFTLISPDVAICDDCLRELNDKNDKRYKFPFINCTNCGPRFTIIKDVPYDREKTTMNKFKMCDSCLSEYKDIEDRRYHAQPNCCFDCGPNIYYLNSDNIIIKENVIESVKNDLKEGKIIAIKGIGGFHLACNAKNKIAVEKLRQRKNREEKPFALMCRDIETVRQFCIVSKEEEEHLTSFRRPIVLLRKKSEIFDYISIDNNYLGIMLPYAPLHFLLFDDELDVLVMTSANMKDKPIIKDNDEATIELKEVADGFLLHNRDIYVRCDDSLIYVYKGNEYFIRRSRGYTPFPIKVEFEAEDILACGAEQKASFCLLKKNYAFLSQHIGDLKNIETYNNYISQIEHFKKLFDINPKKIVCDYHPDYMSTEYAIDIGEKHNKEVYMVQHHHAHMASCMADNNLNGNVIAVTWDGTGLGLDNTLWGGEILYGNYREFERRATIRKIRLAGGDLAIKEIDRIAYDLLYQTFGNVDKNILDMKNSQIINKMIENNVNTYLTSSIGRLFDGVSSLLGLRHYASYEGQGAILLEKTAELNENGVYTYNLEQSDLLVFDWRPMIREIVLDIGRGVSINIIAAKFMNTLVDFAVKSVKQIESETNCRDIVISGGVFQNMYLLDRIYTRLQSDGFNVYIHKRVSTNDEGISLGQLAVVANGGGMRCV